jgi:hypothetical protein
MNIILTKISQDMNFQISILEFLFLTKSRKQCNCSKFLILGWFWMKIFISSRSSYIGEESYLPYWLLRKFIEHFKIGWGMQNLQLDEVLWWKSKLRGCPVIERTLKKRQKPKIMKWKKIFILNDDSHENNGWSLSWMDIIQNFGAL